jgi:hypothetical protein
VSQFQQPGIGGDKFDANNHNGHLLLFFPGEFTAQIATVNGATDCVSARIVDLDTGQVLEDAKVWGKAMVPQLKGAVPDGMVLGRIAQGQNTKGNPPWLINPHSEQDVARAEQWLAANPPASKFAQPQGQAAPPTSNGYNAAPATQAPAWGQQAPAAPAPATGGWGNPPAPAPAQGQFAGQWGAAAPASAVAPPAAPVNPPHPDLVAALLAKGVQLPPGTSHETAEQIWAVQSR